MWKAGAFLPAATERGRSAELKRRRLRYGERGGVDVIIFTGGVGENQTGTRENVCAKLGYMGVEINNELNALSRGKEVLLSTPNSKVKVVVIPTDEEYMIASDTMEILNQQ